VDIQELFESAVRYYESGDWDRANHACVKILKDHPEHADALHLMGLLLMQLERYNLAMQSFEKAIQQKPDDPFLHYNLGNALREDGQNERAIPCFEESLRLDPQMEASSYNLGIIFQKLGETDKAIEYYQKTLRMNPQAADVYNNLGILSQEKGEIDDAIRYFYKAIHINPDYDLAHKNLATAVLKRADIDVLGQQGRLDDALRSRDKNIRGDILISVPVFNRKEITRISLAQTKRYKSPNCHLQVYDDHSTEFDVSFLEPYADEVIRLPEKMGIDKLRWHQFRRFLESDFDFLYMTDNDVIHDPQYIAALEVLYEAGNRKLPVCLFNSEFHKFATLYSENGFLLRLTAPGVSMFYTREMVQKIIAPAESEEYTYLFDVWDFRAIAHLGLPWVVPATSFLEHYGAGGINNRDYDRDRALNPSQYLQEKRDSILKHLKEGAELDIDL
jgi:Tfp pilus assembly protein PilF